LDLEVRYQAVALGCRNLAMPEEVLDRSKASIGVNKLRGHVVGEKSTKRVENILYLLGSSLGLLCKTLPLFGFDKPMEFLEKAQ